MSDHFDFKVHCTFDTPKTSTNCSVQDGWQEVIPYSFNFIHRHRGFVEIFWLGKNRPFRVYTNDLQKEEAK